jgi:hypothetical protein
LIKALKRYSPTLVCILSCHIDQQTASIDVSSLTVNHWNGRYVYNRAPIFYSENYDYWKECMSVHINRRLLLTVSYRTNEKPVGVTMNKRRSDVKQSKWIHHSIIWALLHGGWLIHILHANKVHTYWQQVTKLRKTPQTKIVLKEHEHEIIQLNSSKKILRRKIRNRWSWKPFVAQLLSSRFRCFEYGYHQELLKECIFGY